MSRVELSLSHSRDTLILGGTGVDIVPINDRPATKGVYKPQRNVARVDPDHRHRQ
jgi:hypothetical protein